MSRIAKYNQYGLWGIKSVLFSNETVLKYTKRTKTKTGLKVNAILVEKQYEKGIKASKDDLEKLNIERHEVNPSWNYTLYPN